MFFSWKNIFKNYPQMEKAALCAVTAERNVGKSTDTYKYLLENGALTPNKKVVFLRNTETELKTMIKDFNARFSNQFIASGGFIYSLEKQILIDKKTKDETVKYVKNELVGYMAAVSIYVNYKSVEAKDVKYIVYEEFNEDTSIGRNIYPNFINLITTFIRFNDVKILMIGNRDGFMSDFYINWNIIPKAINIDDELFKIGDVGYWLEMGTAQFANLKNDETAFYKLAMLDNRTAKYSAGGYIQNLNSNVINFKEILKNFSPIYYIALNEKKYIFGKYKSNQYAIISPWNYSSDLDLKTYALDSISRLLKESLIRDNDDLKDFVSGLLKVIKNKSCYFDSYDTLQIFKELTLIVKF